MQNWGGGGGWQTECIMGNWKIVNSLNLPEWQAVKIIFFAPWTVALLPGDTSMT